MSKHLIWCMRYTLQWLQWGEEMLYPCTASRWQQQVVQPHVHVLSSAARRVRVVPSSRSRPCWSTVQPSLPCHTAVHWTHWTLWNSYKWCTPCSCSRDGVSTIQMYSSTSTITLNMHEYEYSDNKCTRVRVQLLYNILEYEYEYFRI